MKNTATTSDVLNYYSKNWKKIAKCYELDNEGFPIDPAWSRKRLYNNFLNKYRPKSLLDIGCGGGWTVLDALKLGINAVGVEPVKELKEFASKLIQKESFNPDLIIKDDLKYIESLPDNSQDCIALLSVIPHVPVGKLEEIHNHLNRILKPNGLLVIAYRNELFDFFTFNSITLDFYKESIWNNPNLDTLNNSDTLELMKDLISNPDLPRKFHTNAIDKSFGKLKRFKTNPLTINSYLKNYNFNLLESNFYHFHAVPPLISEKIKNLKKINHNLELNMSTDWRANFMCPMYLVTAQKNN